MKYVLLIYQPSKFDPSALSVDDHKGIAAEYGALSATPGVTPGLPMGFLKDAVTVRVQDGKTVTASGPYVGDEGAVGGYLVYEADSKEQAIELASRVPAARLGGAVEVRPAEAYW
jgi:hypothetical protein